MTTETKYPQAQILLTDKTICVGLTAGQFKTVYGTAMKSMGFKQSRYNDIKRFLAIIAQNN